jgi:8-oxo-dGTP pyrophosphatase MutT (NUDIX family)
MNSTKIFRAGLVPVLITTDGIKMLFMKPSNSLYGGPFFQIAKGRVEDNEDFKAAAIREGGEELGIRSEDIAKLHYMGKFLGRTHIYACELKSNFKLVDFCWETGDVKWMTLEQFETEGRELHKKIVKLIHEHFSKIEFNSNSKLDINPPLK